MGVREEVEAARAGAGLLDRTEATGRLVIAGPDSAAFLQRVVSQDVEPLREGRGADALFLTPKGRLISAMTLYHRGDHFLVRCPARTAGELAQKLAMYTLGSKADVKDASGLLSLLAVVGPKAAEVLGGTGLPEELNGSGIVPVAGYEVTVCREDDFGLPGYEIHCPASIVEQVAGALRERGAVPIGAEAGETLRIEAGTPEHGAEMDGNLLPPEIPALAARAISYTKGCYVGQETIARIRTYGHVNRELRGLVVRGDAPPPPGTELFVEGKKAGVVTSSCISVTGGIPIALAFVRRQHFEPGTIVTLSTGEEAKVVPAGGPWED